MKSFSNRMKESGP